jgi:glycosyltransferase involved in cell wall biosynthesis
MPGIIHLITGLSTGGAERALYNVLNGGLGAQFENHVISLTDDGTIGPSIRKLQIPVITLGIRGARPTLSSLTKLRRTVRKIQPEVIQGWMYHGNLAATLARFFARGHPPLIWSIRHSLYDLSYEKPMTQRVIKANRFFSPGAEALLYNSSISRSQHQAFGFASVNGQVIPNGIDIERFSFSSSSRRQIRADLGIPLDTRVVGHVARLHPMKNHAGFLRASADLACRFSDVHFLLSGRGVSLKDNGLKQLIPTQLRDRFHLLGERSDVFKLMSAMDVFCLSSAWGEGFPNVIGEAMAMGLPCVATDIGDSGLIIGDCGAVVPSQDEKALADGIEKFLAMPSEDRRSIGASACSRIRARYSLESAVKQYAALYEDLLSAKGSV